MDIVINTTYGGFDLSPNAIVALAKRKGVPLFIYRREDTFDSKAVLVPLNMEDYNSENPWSLRYMTAEAPSLTMMEKEYDDYANKSYFNYYDMKRNDPDLVAVVRELGGRAGACLKVVSIPDNVDWQIAEYDGMEWVEEKHRTWS